MNNTEQLLSMAQSLAEVWPNFLAKKGAGAGDLDTSAFMRELRSRALQVFGCDFAEKRICGTNKLTVDYYFPEGATIVEIAMSLRNPQSEFERDILNKPGASATCSRPGISAFSDWAKRIHDIEISVYEFTPAERIPNEPG